MAKENLCWLDVTPRLERKRSNQIVMPGEEVQHAVEAPKPGARLEQGDPRSPLTDRLGAGTADSYG